MGELHIDIVGEIGNSFFGETGGVSAKSISEKISKNKKAEVIILNIDSPGGSVYEGYAISNLIFEQKTKGKEVRAVIKGMCASIATLIALSADKVTMLPFSSWMIHNPFVGLQGDAEELKRAASELEKIQNKLIEVYAKKTGKETVEIQALMNEQKTLSAREAVEMGFADEVLEEIKAVAYWKNKETKLDMEDKDRINQLVEGFKNLETKFKKIFKAEGDTPANLETTLEDGTAVVIDPAVQEGATVTVAGTAAKDGDYTLSDGTKITVKDGMIASIVTASDEAPAEDLKKEIEDLKAKLAEAEAKAEATAKAAEEKILAAKTELETEIKNLRKLTIGGSATPVKPAQNFNKGKETVSERASAFNQIAQSIKK